MDGFISKYNLLGTRKLLIFSIAIIMGIGLGLTLTANYKIIIIFPLTLFSIITLTFKKKFGLIILLLNIILLNFLFALISLYYPMEHAAFYKLIYTVCRQGAIYFFLGLTIFDHLMNRKPLIISKNKAAWYFLALGIAYLILPIGSASLAVKIGSFKQIFDFVILFIVGTLYSGQWLIEKRMPKLYNRMLLISVLFVISSLIEIVWFYVNGRSLIIDAGFIRYINLMQLANEGIYGTESSQIIENLPGNFFTEFPLMGGVVRNSSLLLDPVAMSMLFAIFILISLITKKKSLVILNLIGCFFTFGKTGLILAFTIFSAQYFFKLKLNYKTMTFLIIVFIICLIPFSLDIAGASNHISGLIDNFRYLPSYPVGRGLGSVGNLANTVSIQSGLPQLSESLLGVIVGQMGILGLALFLYFLYTLIKLNAQLLKQINNNVVYYYFIFAIVGIFLASLFSEAALQANATGLLAVIIGLQMGNRQVSD